MSEKSDAAETDLARSASQPLTLYSTSACHLCDEAEAMLRYLVQSGLPLTWERIDIANDDALFERYGWLIPVLRRIDSSELNWPFDLQTLREFLQQS